MKHSFLLLSAAAALVMAACSQEIVPEKTVVPDDTVARTTGPRSFTASFECDPDSKAVLGLNGNGKPQMFWENGDDIVVYSSGNSLSGTVTGYKFTANISANSTSADFDYNDVDGLLSGDYFATYPYRKDSRGVNFEVSPYRVAAVDVPKSQTLVAGTVDRKACPMVAHASEGSDNLEFKNAAALLKFRVSGSNIVAGRIEVDAGDKISGRFLANVDVTTFIPTLNTYTGQTTYNYIDFSIDGSTALSTGTDYYVAIRPTTLTSDLKIYLNGNLVKVINASSLAEIQRNKIYNLGTLAIPAIPQEKKLTFDFTGTPFTGWPTAKDQLSTNQAGGLGCVYPLYGTDYTFTLADCSGASGRRVYWSTTVTYGHRIVFENAERYFGFPAIPGYKLKHVTCTSAQLNDASASTKPQMGIVATVLASGAAQTYISGGELKTWAAGNNHESYDYELTGTEANTIYYLFCKIKGGFKEVTLTYIPI